MKNHNKLLSFLAILIIVFLYLVLAIYFPADEVKQVIVERCENNPLITQESSESIGNNINGPSVIRTPSWIKDPLGKYYMYFAHHAGKYIRLAYADKLEGPWTIYEPGVLKLEEATPFIRHIASPDVHVDNENQRILMYFHGVIKKTGQWTGLAKSVDGITFSMVTGDKILGHFYFRVFQWDKYYYAIAKFLNETGVLYRSKDGKTPFTLGKKIIPRMRHAAVLLKDNLLFIFYSRIGDKPERILLSTMRLTDNWNEWKPSEPIEVIRPEKDYEGANYPVKPSNTGLTINKVHQLRDPAIFEENDKLYLFYSIAGESGIAMAKIKLILKE